jgi:exoribonuclease R
VHRLLASIIDQNEVKLESKYFEQMADNCNDKKSSARVCSQKSTDMFFAFYLKVLIKPKAYFV